MAETSFDCDTVTFASCVTTISPELAGELFGERVPNRTLKERNIKDWSIVMEEGRWVPWVGAITRLNGRVVDGQNRLAAIVKSGVCVDIIVNDIECSDAATCERILRAFDVGMKRSPADQCAILRTLPGVSQKTIQIITSSIGIAFRVEFNRKQTPDQVVDYIKSRKGTMSHLAHQFVEIVPDTARLRGAIFGAWHSLRVVDSSKADEFMRMVFSSGTLDSEHPAAAVSRWITNPVQPSKQMLGGKYPPRVEYLAYSAIIVGFKAWIDGTTRTKLYPMTRGGAKLRGIRTEFPKALDLLEM